MNFLFIFVFLLLGTFVKGLDENSAKEQLCSSLTLQSDPNLDMKWMKSVTRWYYQIYSKLQAYRTAAGHVGKPVSDISPSVLTKPCVTCNATFYCEGFGAPPVQYDVHYDSEHHILYKANRDNARLGDEVLVLTDNKNFMIGVTCWEDGEATYAVWTTSPDPLSAEDKTKVLNKIDELKFKKEFIMETKCTK